MSAYLFTGEVTDLMVPADPQADQAVAANFERFDGLTPLDHPAAADPDSGGSGGGGSAYGWNSDSPRPGQSDQPLGQVYTSGPIAGVVGVTGGQPLPRSPFMYKQAGGYTRSRTHTVQFRLGDGQRGKSALGAAQTVQLGEITDNPPQPGDLASIIGGWG